MVLYPSLWKGLLIGGAVVILVSNDKQNCTKGNHEVWRRGLQGHQKFRGRAERRVGRCQG
jgi:hypothetical protein